jgi:hypothetical protein
MSKTSPGVAKQPKTSTKRAKEKHTGYDCGSTIKDYLVEHVEDHSNRASLVKACAKDLGVHLSNVYRNINKGALKDATFNTGASAHSTTRFRRSESRRKGMDKAINLDDIKEEIDIPSQIRATIKDLGSKVLKDQDFRAALRVDKETWQEVLDTPSLSAYHVTLVGRKSYTIWGNPDALKQLTDQLELI